MRNGGDFTPAPPLLWAYDLIVAAFTRNAHDGVRSYDSWIFRMETERAIGNDWVIAETEVELVD